MKKNKGFTLIELLAVIVITGLLSVMVIPKISTVVTETRMKIYIQDAKKMITQVQYRMSSNNLQIQKPEIGEVIVFSLKYLSANDFRNPPNKGEYLPESSFVVVKNEDGNYEYAVMLVEYTKEHLYQGVEFVTENQVNRKDAIKHVRYFDNDEIRFIETATEEDEEFAKSGQETLSYIDIEYINDSLGKAGVGTATWLDSSFITRSYNVTKADETVMTDAAAPKFKTKITSAESSGVGSLDAILTVEATDDDDPVKSLIVCYRVSDSDSGEYPTPSTTPELCHEYGDSKTFSRNINFANYGLNDVDKTLGFVFITVSDPSGHIVKKMREYDIHKNEGPVIRAFSINKKDGDMQNLSTVKLTLDADDENRAALQVCFAQDYYANNDRCPGEYVSFSSKFANYVTSEYTFVDSRGKALYPDGSTHSLTIFLKDSNGLISYTTTNYKLHNNKAPEFDSFVVTPIPYEKAPEFNSLYFYLTMDISDDTSDANNIYIQVGDDEPMTYAQYKQQYYSVPHTGGISGAFKAPGVYDGKKKEVFVKVWDELQRQYGLQSDANFRIATIENLYTASIPQFAYDRVESATQVCTDSNHCLTKDPGSATIKFKNPRFTDINNSSQSDLSRITKVCISANKDDCYAVEENAANFVTIDKIKNKNYKLKLNNKTNYATEEEVYFYYNTIVNNKFECLLVANDICNPTEEGYGCMVVGGEECTPQSVKYTTYGNKAPEIHGNLIVTPAAKEFDVNTSAIHIDISKLTYSDDFNDYKISFCYRDVSDGSYNGEYRCTPKKTIEQFTKDYIRDEVLDPKTGRTTVKDLSFIMLDNDGNDYVSYTNQEMRMYIKVLDHFNTPTLSEPVTYRMSDAGAPIITDVILIPQEFEDEVDETGSNTFNVKFRVMDPSDTYTICLKEIKDNRVESCTDAEFIGNPLNGGEPYDGDNLNSNFAYFNGVDSFDWDPDYDPEHKEGDRTKYFHFEAKDSTGKITEWSERLVYKLYTSCVHDETKDNRVGNKFVSAEFTGGTEISAQACHGRCLDIGENVGVRAYYIQHMTSKDAYSGVTCLYDERTEENCTNRKCLDVSNLSQYTFYSANYEAVSPSFQTQNSEITETVESDTPRNTKCNNLRKLTYSYSTRDTTFLFSMLDYKCEEKSNGVYQYCNRYADNLCDGEREYADCMTREASKCQQLMDEKCANPVTKTYEKVTCTKPNTPDGEWADFIEIYCNQNSEDYKQFGFCVEPDPECMEAAGMSNSSATAPSSVGNDSASSSSSCGITPGTTRPSSCKKKYQTSTGRCFPYCEGTYENCTQDELDNIKCIPQKDECSVTPTSTIPNKCDSSFINPKTKKCYPYCSGTYTNCTKDELIDKKCTPKKACEVHPSTERPENCYSQYIDPKTNKCYPYCVGKDDNCTEDELSSIKCTPTKYVLHGDLPDYCVRVCLNKYNCTKDTHQEPKIYTCNYVYRKYKAKKIVGSNVILFQPYNTGDRLCQSFVDEHRDRFYSFEQKYIQFDDEAEADYFTIGS